MLFDEGLTAKGKPLVYHLMNEDLKKAYEFAKEEAKCKKPINSAFLQKLNSTLMRTTGSIYNVMGGSFDSFYVRMYLLGVRNKSSVWLNVFVLSKMYKILKIFYPICYV